MLRFLPGVIPRNGVTSLRAALRAWCEFSELVYISLYLSYHGVSSPNSVQYLDF
jgi:hypothetical protein